MDQALVNIQAKIDRANEHIGDFESVAVKAFDPTTHLRRYYDAEAGKIVFCLDGDIPTVPTKLNILCGECVYQLRSALNHLVYAVSTAKGKQRDRLEFPIFDCEAGFHSRKKSRLKGVDLVVRSFIESHQPFQRTGAPETHPLWKLHKLQNADKHTSLIAISVKGYPPALGFDGTYVERKVEFFSGSKCGAILATIDTDDPKLDVHVQPQIHVFIDDVDHFGFTSAAQFMKRLSSQVREIVDGVAGLI